MAVGIWDAEQGGAPDAETLRALLAGWVECGAGEETEATRLVAALPPSVLARLPTLMRSELADWVPLLPPFTDAELADLVRAFALLEVGLADCEAGKRSPAIACARELRARGSYPSDLTRWLRRHSSNRFLPYGSLLDSSR